MLRTGSSHGKATLLWLLLAEWGAQNDGLEGRQGALVRQSGSDAGREMGRLSMVQQTRWQLTV